MGSVSSEEDTLQGDHKRRPVLTPSEHQFYRQRSSCYHLALAESSGTPAPRPRGRRNAAPSGLWRCDSSRSPRASPWAIERAPLRGCKGPAFRFYLFCRP